MTGAVKEDEILTATGQLTIDDVDGEREFIPVVDHPLIYGLFSLTKDGTWTYKIYDRDSLSSTWEDSVSFWVESKDGTRAEITITVNGTNDAPIIHHSGNFSANEEGATDVLLRSTDPDNDSVIYSSPDHPEHGSVWFWGDHVTYTPDTDFYGWDSFAVVAHDRYGGISETIYYTVLVGNEWEAPFGTDKSVAIVEDGSHTIKVADFGFSDYKDAGSQIHDFDAAIISAVNGAGELWFGNAELDLSGGAVRISKADIEAGKLVWKPDADTTGEAQITFKVKDDSDVDIQDNNTSKDANTLTITVAAVNDAPSFTAGANQAVDEDSGQHTVAGWATGISAGPADESTQTLAFSVSNDNNALFKVQPSIGLDGTLTYELAADANGMATVSVTLTDSGSGDGANSNASAPITVTIAAAPINDAPVVAVSPTYTVSENVVGATLGKVLASDVEGDPIGYELSINTGDDKNPVWVPTDLFVIVGDELRLAAGKSLDYETTTSFSLKIVATETAGLAPKSAPAFTTIRVNDVNENPAPVNQAPTVTSPNADAQIEAGQTISLTIGDAHFFDPEGTDLNYSITVNGAALPSWMTFDTTSGAFTGKPASAEAGNYVITVTASDGALNTSDTFNLLVTSPAAPEATILLSGDEVAENSARGTVVGALSGTDADGDAFVSFSLGANPGKVFRIADGELVVRGNAKLDFETKPAYEITVIARDDDGATVEKAFTITLTDVAEDPVGTKGNDRLFGDALDNIINGRRGNDRLTGGDGADTFVFGKGFGKDAILDFDPTEGDVIDLSRMVGVESFEDLIADHAAQSKTHVRIIADDGSVLTIQNFDLADLKADMFLF
jgi:VCBS repeat-containing protein